VGSCVPDDDSFIPSDFGVLAGYMALRPLSHGSNTVLSDWSHPRDFPEQWLATNPAKGPRMTKYDRHALTAAVDALGPKRPLGLSAPGTSYFPMSRNQTMGSFTSGVDAVSQN
jgi:hypothetical protein